MNNLLKEHFSVSYENGGSASYLVISTNPDEKVINYQVEMIINNPINNILPMDVRQKDENISFYYDITSKLSLAQLFKHRKFKRNEFLSLLLSITKAVMDCRGYLLYERCTVMDAEYIYVSPDTLQAALIYIPIELEYDINNRFRDFMVNIIIGSADIDDREDDNFLQRIISCLKQNSFSISVFHDLMIELLQHNAKLDDSEVFTHLPEESRTSANKKLEVPSLPKKLGGINKPEAKKAELKNNAVTFSRTMPAAIIGVLDALIIILSAVNRNFIHSLNNDTTVTYAGIGLIIIALDILIFRKLQENKIFHIIKDNNKASHKADKHTDSVGSQMWSMTGHLDEIYKDGLSGTGTEKEVAEHDPQSNDISCFNNNAGRSDTVILNPGEEKNPYLQTDADNIQEKIYITKESFIIGRLKEQVDYEVDNNAVGKMHAQITYSEDTYFIKDLNSRNGTFINGLRIKSNSEYEIKNGDKVTLANSDYVFIVP